MTFLSPLSPSFSLSFSRTASFFLSPLSSQYLCVSPINALILLSLSLSPSLSLSLSPYLPPRVAVQVGR